MRAELWVKHDTRSRQDGKMRWFLKRAGQEGYGTFWSTIEILHYQNDHTIPTSGPEFEGLAEDLFLTPERYLEILKIAVAAGLFRLAGERLWQERLKQDEAERSTTKQNAGRLGGLRSGEARRRQRGAASEAEDPNLGESQESAKQNEAAPILLEATKLEEREEIDEKERSKDLKKPPPPKNEAEPRSKRDDAPPGYRANCEPIGEYGHVWLTPAEIEALSDSFGKHLVLSKVVHLDAQIENRVGGYLKYKNHAACIRNWCTSDRVNGRVPKEEPLPEGFTWVDRSHARGPDGEVHHISFIRNLTGTLRAEAAGAVKP